MTEKKYVYKKEGKICTYDEALEICEKGIDEDRIFEILDTWSTRETISLLTPEGRMYLIEEVINDFFMENFYEIKDCR